MAQNTAQAAAVADKVLYTAHVHVTGGREKGEARSDDGRLDIKLSVPGTPGTGTNPEQLLAAGWSACYEGALMVAARNLKVTPPANLAVDTEVDLNVGGSGFFLRARMNVSLPGFERAVAQKLVETAHGICPYSKALRNSIDLTTTVA